MENASKALIIAGEILIGILILSLASYIVIQFGNFSKNINKEIEESQIVAFNVKFTNYSGKANISAQDIVSLINFANKHNEEYEAESDEDYYVDICIDGGSILNTNINEFLETNKNNTYYYCNLQNLRIREDGDILEVSALTTQSDITYNEHTGLVNKIDFHTISGLNVGKYVKALLEGNKIVWNIDNV